MKPVTKQFKEIKKSIHQLGLNCKEDGKNNSDKICQLQKIIDNVEKELKEAKEFLRG